MKRDVQKHSLSHRPSISNESTAWQKQQPRNVDVNEKFQLWKSQIDADFGLYVNNRDNIDKVNNRINAELFSLYKYTRDKDDETRQGALRLEGTSGGKHSYPTYQDKSSRQTLKMHHMQSTM